jgi:RNA polymerase sigma-70 factor (ECF subfamily)
MVSKKPPRSGGSDSRRADILTRIFRQHLPGGGVRMGRMEGAGMRADLLAHGEFLRRLARCLAADAADADDLVQDTFTAALRSPAPDLSRPLRPWLSQVLRNAHRSARRARSRRRAREQAVVAGAGGDAPGVEETLARLQLQRRIVDLVTGLEEPYRTILLLRFYEGRDASEIGRAMGIPAGTVRWRISTALERMRAALDEGRDRRRWRALLLPLPGGLPRRARPRPAALVAESAVVALASALLIVAVVRPPRSTHPVRQKQSNLPAMAGTSKETMPMITPATKTAAVLFGLALPALAAGAQNKIGPGLRDRAIDACVDIREQVFACDKEFADLFVQSVPPERQAAVRSKVLQDIALNGAGPLEPRRARCGARVDEGPPPTSERLTNLQRLLADCRAKPDCKERSTCLWPVVVMLRQTR